MLDCSCGIGTRAIGLALRGHRVTGTDLSVRAAATSTCRAHRTTSTCRAHRAPDPAGHCCRAPATGRLSDRVREQHAAVHALIREGVSLCAIGRRLGLARGTIRRLAHAADPDEPLVGRWTGLTA
ncbi:hypothetical protein ACWDFR_43675 [Streptomyces sp. 900105755]